MPAGRESREEGVWYEENECNGRLGEWLRDIRVKGVCTEAAAGGILVGLAPNPKRQSTTVNRATWLFTLSSGNKKLMLVIVRANAFSGPKISNRPSFFWNRATM